MKHWPRWHIQQTAATVLASHSLSQHISKDSAPVATCIRWWWRKVICVLDSKLLRSALAPTKIVPESRISIICTFSWNPRIDLTHWLTLLPPTALQLKGNKCIELGSKQHTHTRKGRKKTRTELNCPNERIQSWHRVETKIPCLYSFTECQARRDESTKPKQPCLQRPHGLWRRQGSSTSSFPSVLWCLWRISVGLEGSKEANQRV